MSAKIKQGDAYALPIELKMDGKPLEPSLVEAVEVYFGRERLLWPGELDYEDGTVLVPLTQERTLALREGYIFIDVRVKLVGGSVLGIPNKLLAVVSDAESEEVL